MGTPKNCLQIVFVDVPPHSNLGLSRLLFLPLKRSRRYFREFSSIVKNNQILFLRLNSFPSKMFQYLYPVFSFLLTDHPFSILNCDFELSDVSSPLFVQNMKNRKMKRWMRIMRRVEKNQIISESALFVCAVLLSHAISENQLKRELRLTTIVK